MTREREWRKPPTASSTEARMTANKTTASKPMKEVAHRGATGSLGEMAGAKVHPASSFSATAASDLWIFSCVKGCMFGFVGIIE